MNQWQPIETAPKDINILVWVPESKRMTVAHKRDDRFYDESEEEISGPLDTVTHWMPLPAAPEG